MSDCDVSKMEEYMSMPYPETEEEIDEYVKLPSLRKLYPFLPLFEKSNKLDEKE